MNFKETVGGINIQLNTDRIDGNIRKAQKLLNEQISEDCKPLIPRQQGALANSVNYPEGIYGGELSWNTPYAHYQYEGELYLTEDGRSWANQNERKYPAKPKRMLNYHMQGTSDHWFEKAKEQKGKHWVELVKRTAGKG